MSDAPEELEKEIELIKVVGRAMDGAQEGTRIRVLNWVLQRYSVFPTKATSIAPSRNLDAQNRQTQSEFETFAELHSAASPATDSDNALLGAYRLQVVEGRSDFAAQEVNDLLKDLGHAVGNITMAFNSLKAQKPALVLQLQKSGTTKQARKKYKMTIAGIKYVENMLSATDRGEP